MLSVLCFCVCGFLCGFFFFGYLFTFSYLLSGNRYTKKWEESRGGWWQETQLRQRGGHTSEFSKGKNPRHTLAKTHSPRLSTSERCCDARVRVLLSTRHVCSVSDGWDDAGCGYGQKRPDCKWSATMAYQAAASWCSCYMITFVRYRKIDHAITLLRFVRWLWKKIQFEGGKWRMIVLTTTTLTTTPTLC